MCECKFVCSSVCVTVSNRSYGLIHRGFHLASVKTWLWEIRTVLASPLPHLRPPPSQYDQKNLKNVFLFFPLFPPPPPFPPSTMHWVSVLIHPPVLKSGLLYYFFFQTPIYRKAVSYLTSSFFFSFPSFFHILLTGEHPVLPNNQPSLWEYRTKKKSTSIFVPCVIRKYLCIIKNFLCVCVQLIIIIIIKREIVIL